MDHFQPPGARHETSRNIDKWGPTLFFALLTVGRLLGGVVLTVMSPLNCFTLSAILGLLGTWGILSGSHSLAIIGVIAAGLGFANIWPMLFSITVERKPECANELSGLMCMAISGGALVPLLMGWLMDLGWGVRAFMVPSMCFLYLMLLALGGRLNPTRETLGKRAESLKI